MSRKITFIAILLLAVIAILAACKGNATAKETGEFTFAKNDDMVSYVLTGYTGTDRGIKIPSKYDGYPVRIIGSGAFINNQNLQSIVIPNTVINIEDGAFYACSELTSITISKSVTSIGNNAFYGCGKLTSIYYQGTQEEWKAISNIDYIGLGYKDHSKRTENYIIYCSDGNISK